MKRAISIIIICILIFSPGYAQKALSIKGEKIKDGIIYLTFDGETLEYFTPDKTLDSRKSVQESMTFSLVNDNSCNIYLRWINPLKYRLIWKDTTYIDERDKAINDFINLLVAQFGSAVTSLKKSDDIFLFDTSTEKPARDVLIKLDVPEKGFINNDLNLLYLQLRSNLNSLTNNEIKTINELTPVLSRLDILISENISKKVDKIFENLFNIDHPDNVNKIVSLIEAQIVKFGSTYKEIEDLQTGLQTSLSEFTLNDNLLNTYFEIILTKFIDQTTTTLSLNKRLTEKLKPVVNIIKNSINDESSNSAAKGFYRIRSVGFEDGKKLETSLTIVEFEYKKETKDFEKKRDLIKKTIIFQKYDFFAISVSTGLFYSSTTLKGYGVANSNDEQFIVTEDDITKSSPVTAIFLNFNFGIGSRYFAPLLQAGIDPTKKRPFLLLGGGFSIPSARIAITGGPIWTWNPYLENLSVGQTISSTTELENDIQYKFDMQPKGWYLGIQYNF